MSGSAFLRHRRFFVTVSTALFLYHWLGASPPEAVGMMGVRALLEHPHRLLIFGWALFFFSWYRFVVASHEIYVLRSLVLKHAATLRGPRLYLAAAMRDAISSGAIESDGVKAALASLESQEKNPEISIANRPLYALPSLWFSGLFFTGLDTRAGLSIGSWKTVFGEDLPIPRPKATLWYIQGWVRAAWREPDIIDYLLPHLIGIMVLVAFGDPKLVGLAAAAI